jgi:hypothetical protein
MKNKVLGVFAAMAIAGTIVAAQSPQPQTPSSPATPSTPSTPATPATPSTASRSATASDDQSLTGCLIQGSGPTVFLLENAKTSGSTGSMASSSASSRAGESERSSSSVASSSGKTYIVTASASSVDLKSQLNHQVTVTGMGDESASASSQTARMNEKDMPKFSAKTVTKISDTCSSAG